MVKSVFEQTGTGARSPSPAESGEHFLSGPGAELPKADVGRKSGFSLKQAQPETIARYRELSELRHKDYSVYLSPVESGRFLVVPWNYLVARHEPNHVHAYEPQVSSCMTLDAARRGTAEDCITAVVMPDLSRAQRQSLQDCLRKRYHPSAVLEFPSEVAAGLTCRWNFSSTVAEEERPNVRTVRCEQGLRVTIATRQRRHSQVTRMLKDGDLSAQVHFQLEDGTDLLSELRLGMNQLCGPWLGGPLEERREGGALILTNRIEQPVWIWEVLCGSETEYTRIFSIGERLLPGEGLRVDGVPTSQAVLPVCEVHSREVSVSAAPRAEIRSVVFVNSLDLKAMGAECLMIESRIEGLDEAPSVALSENAQVVEVEYVLPFEMASEEVILEYRVSSWNDQGEEEQGHWQQRQLLVCGNIVEIAMSTIRS